MLDMTYALWLLRTLASIFSGSTLSSILEHFCANKVAAEIWLIER